MSVYKVWWLNRDKQLWEGQGEHEKEKKTAFGLSVPTIFVWDCVREEFEGVLTDTDVNLYVGRSEATGFCFVRVSIVFRERFYSSELSYFGITQLHKECPVRRNVFGSIGKYRNLVCTKRYTNSFKWAIERDNIARA